MSELLLKALWFVAKWLFGRWRVRRRVKRIRRAKATVVPYVPSWKALCVAEAGAWAAQRRAEREAWARERACNRLFVNGVAGLQNVANQPGFDPYDWTPAYHISSPVTKSLSRTINRQT